MASRTVWSPSRIRTALQCGRRLQASIEHWERRDHIRGIRGRAAHRAIEAWEGADRTSNLIDSVIDAWWDILAPSLSAPDALLVGVRRLWVAEAEVATEEAQIVEGLSGQYKNPRATKAYREATVHLDGARATLAEQRRDVEAAVDAVEWPWDSGRGMLAEGLDHSLETVRRGMDYLAGLWPDPDIVGAEWELEAPLPNGYRLHGFIDRVEGSDGVVEVVDYKSSRFQDTPLDHFLQVSTYALLAARHMGFPPDRVRLVYLRDQSSDMFRVLLEPWISALMELVEAADRVLESRSFTPTFSGCGICSWQHLCDAEFPLIPITETTDRRSA